MPDRTGKVYTLNFRRNNKLPFVFLWSFKAHRDGAEGSSQKHHLFSTVSSAGSCTLQRQPHPATGHVWTRHWSNGCPASSASVGRLIQRDGAIEDYDSPDSCRPGQAPLQPLVTQQLSDKGVAIPRVFQTCCKHNQTGLFSCTISSMTWINVTAVLSGTRQA